MTSWFFGRRYDAPIYEDAELAPTPVGRECYQCGEPVADGDDGWIRPLLHANETATAEPIHRECDLLGVVGHMVGVCPCSVEWRDRPVREQAREAMSRWAAGWGRDVQYSP